LLPDYALMATIPSASDNMNEPEHNEEAILEAAAQLPAEQRMAYLIEACGGDAQQRQRLEVLLALYDRGSDFMEEPAAGGSKNRLLPILMSEKPGDWVGRYKLLQQIGEGGCGVVYMAEQESPIRRRVALKVIKLGMDTKNVIARFEAERQALALMDHPNIAKIFDAGATETGRPFFVMELVSGIKITEFCDERRAITEERLKLFVQICQAVQHAHQKGLIHRDIKPSNILVTMNDGIPVPKLIDFGIAKATSDQRLTDKTVFTAFEQFIGTPSYMSPEQAEMTETGIDTRSDIYSLGVLLYELLTGMTPFDAQRLRQSGLDEIRRIIREEEPEQPSTRLRTMTAANLTKVATHRDVEPARLGNIVRGELDWIVMKALEKDCARRYETADGLATDVQRYLAGEPVVARPSSNLYRFQKLVRRNKLATAATITVLLSLIIGLGISLLEFAQKSRAEREQSRLLDAAQKQEFSARQKAYAVSMNLIQQALNSDNLGRATELLNEQRPKTGQKDLRGWEWRYLWQHCRSDAETSLCNRSNLVTSVSFSRDGSLLAVANGPGEVSVWDISAGKTILQAAAPSAGIPRVAFAPDGDLLAFTEASNIVIWNSLTRSRIASVPTGGLVVDMRFISRNKLIAANSHHTNNVSVWEPVRGSLLTNFTAPIFQNLLGTKITFDGHGDVLAHAFSEKEIGVAAVGRSTNIWTLSAAEELVTAIAFSPDGKTLATGEGYSEGAIKLWDLRTGNQMGQLEGHRSWIGCLKFLPNGNLASGSADQTIRIWDVTNRRSLRTLRGHTSEVRSLDVSADGRVLASGSKEGIVLLWNLASLGERSPDWATIDPASKPGPIFAFEFSPDGRFIGAVEDTRTIKIYDATNLHLVATPDLGLTGRIPRLLFSPDSRLIVAIDSTGTLGVWDNVHERLVTNFTAHTIGARLLGSSFFRHGQTLVTQDAHGVAKEWDTSSWKQTAQWSLAPPPFLLKRIYDASSSSGILAVSPNDQDIIEGFSLDAPTIRHSMHAPERSVALAFSPDGNTLAAATEGGLVALWDSQTLTSVGILHDVLLGLHSVTFSPDGQRLAAGGDGREAIKIWDPESHEDLATLQGKGSLMSNVRFSPDGNSIAARNWNGMLEVWRAPSWAEIEATEKKQ
jgi:WD40 repeat protein